MDISFWMRRLAERKNLPPIFNGEALTRIEACDFCGSRSAIRLAKMDYWDLSEHDLVCCQSCRLMQIDPMLSEADLALGCKAFYQFEKREHGIKEVRRSCLRNFRKGVSFGMDLMAEGISPTRSLELGAGDAYFSRGLQFVFPKLKVCCLDVVPEILTEIRRQHGFDTISTPPEKMSSKESGKFDLVIGRDILEHVRKPATVLKNIFEMLEPGGALHFITPNGYEDVWFTYGFWQLHQKPSEHLINHVSFFPVRTLRAELAKIGFSFKRWIIFDFKGTLREGKGSRIDPKQLARPSERRSAKQTIAETAQSSVNFSSVDPCDVLHVPWIKSRTFAQFYCHAKHRPRWYCDADVGVGHEIYGLVQKPLSS